MTYKKRLFWLLSLLMLLGTTLSASTPAVHQPATSSPYPATETSEHPHEELAPTELQSPIGEMTVGTSSPAHHIII